MTWKYEKVRIGLTITGWPFPEYSPIQLWDYAERSEELNIDSLWFTDRIVSPLFSLETIVAMSFIASRTDKLKIGTSVIALPLRNPTILAKEIATLDYLSNGRCLPAVGLGSEEENEYEACGTTKQRRVTRTEEAVTIMRLLWSEDDVTYRGKHFTLNNVTVRPKPAQKELPPIWFGGRSEAALNRTARMGDGWLVSNATPEEIAVSIPRIKEMALENDNHIEDDHYGVLFNYCFADTIAEAERLSSPHSTIRRTDVTGRDLHAYGPPEILIDLLERHIDAGITKFTLRPACPTEMTFSQMEILGTEIIPKYHNDPRCE